MVIAPIFISLFFGGLFYIIYKDIFYPGCMFNMVWCFVLLADAMNIATLYSIKSDVYFIISIGLLFYNIGFLFFKIRVKTRQKKVMLDNNSNVINKRFLGVQIIIGVFLLILLSRMAIYILDGNWYIVRRIYTSGTYEDGSRFMSTFERMLYISYVIFPLAYVNFSLGTVGMLDGVISKKCYYIAVINMCIVTLVTGGRLSVFYMLIVFVVMYSSVKKKSGFVQISPIKRNIIILAAFAFAFFNIMLRSNSSSVEFVKGLITYFVGGMHVFDNALRNPADFGLTEYTFGVMTFRGFFESINIILYYASGRMIPLLASKFSNAYFDNALEIGIEATFNAFPTIFYYHYRDLKYLGICIFPLILSGVFNMIYNGKQRITSYFNICLLAEITYYIIMSPCWSSFIQAEVWSRLLYFMILNKFYGLDGREVGGQY